MTIQTVPCVVRSDELGGLVEKKLGILEWRLGNTVDLCCPLTPSINLSRVPLKMNVVRGDLRVAANV